LRTREFVVSFCPEGCTGSMLSEDDLLFGKIAIDLHLLDPAQLERVKTELATSNRRIGEYLMQKGLLRFEDLAPILAEQKKRKAQKRDLLKDKSLGFCLRAGHDRYRTCLYKQVNGWEGAFRVIPD
jgi:hypothetical protein